MSVIEGKSPVPLLLPPLLWADTEKMRWLAYLFVATCRA